VYWSLPVLTTTVYPRYGEALWRQVREERPLIVEHRLGRYKPFRISGYAVLAAAQSDYGHWYLYASDDDAQGREQVSTFLASDGSTEQGFSEEDGVPELAFRLSQNPEGEWRGRVRLSDHGTVYLPGESPLELVDPPVRNAASPVNVYTWPSNLRFADLSGPIEPVSTDLVWRAGRGDIVREFGPGVWRVDGQAQEPFSYLLQWREESIAQGASFVARGELFEGGVQIGFLENHIWSGSVTITHTGPFEAVIEMQRPGRYGLVVANAIGKSWWARARGDVVGGLWNLVRGRLSTNRFRVLQAGWISLRSSPAAASALNAADTEDTRHK
jgi:hypothetical protein